MSLDRKRLNKIEESLTPKQAMILWMSEAHQYSNLFEYASYLKTQPDIYAPIGRLPDQVEKSTRTAMKGKNRDLVNMAVRRAIRDVCFLFHIHLKINQEVTLEQRAWKLTNTVLVERLIRIINEQSTARRERYITDCMTERINRELPYPLNPDTAAAVDAAIRHNITTWYELEEDEIESWLCNHLISQGAVQLTYDSYEFRDGKLLSKLNENNENHIRECFRDEGQFERFRSGQDFNHGLVGVTDAEFNAL